MADHDYRDVLLKAASLVEEKWFQGELFLLADGTTSPDAQRESYHDVVGACALGAIRLAHIELFGSFDFDLYKADQALADQLPSTWVSIVDWNDADGRTADEVAEALRRAAE